MQNPGNKNYALQKKNVVLLCNKTLAHHLKYKLLNIYVVYTTWYICGNWKQQLHSIVTV